ncbi:aspartate/glutamate racemase family protein [Spiractinospora alimapuensis]|uniref:aspartate/glutamate racemase family protein n=1 Tax=Spiractinospora alimapuensis TaxID=2820884 RepID=UPI001F31AA4C|nr:aspartate/glutamate racemase family protein [Spiractinospora alimapuensis]QVQ54492.1 aspartate/glutamate racemase family protein [Spiractinospora alimapuensis]
MMRLTYLLPAPMHATELGETEMRRRAGLLAEWSPPGTEITVSAVSRGPVSIESAYEDYLSIPAMADQACASVDAGADAIVVGCFGDPGLDGLRELVRRPVIGPSAAAMSLAASLGHQFSVVTVVEGVRPLLRRLAWEAGLSDALGVIRAVELPVIDLNRDHERAFSVLRGECERVLAETDTDTLVLGCMSMGFLGAAERLTEELGVPVVNPVRAAVHQADTLHRMGLAHSPRAYRTPAKLRQGTNRADLIRTTDAPLEVTP